MKKKFTRLTAFLVIVVVIFTLLISRLAYLQLINGDYYSEIAEAMGEKPKTVLAPRGEILDRNGKKLATNRLGYSIIYTAPSGKVNTDTLNSTIVEALNIIYKHNEQNKIVSSSVPLNFDFDQNKVSIKSKSTTIYDLYKSAQSIVDSNKLETYYNRNFDKNVLTEFEKKLESIKDDTGELKEEEKRKFEKEKLAFFNPETAAKEIFFRLAEKFGFGSVVEGENPTFNGKYNLPDDKLFYAISIRYNLKNSVYKQYEDIELVKNVSKETAWEFQIKSSNLIGISSQIIPIRYYPYGEVGSAFMGYLGKISNAERYERLGYDVSRELIGVTGLEYVLENRENNDMDIQLRGEPGVTYLKVDKLGKIIEETGNIEPVPGDTVVTTINADMQAAAEQSLDDVMSRIRNGNTDKSISYDGAYPSYRGAVVAMDINTGEILALASRPGFNPNDFAESGVPSDPALLEKYFLTEESRKKLDEDKYGVIPRPMYNYATKGAVPPGSTFKPFTAIAGLEEGVITASTIIYDTGRYTETSPAIKCWIYPGKHGATDVVKALKVSCNFFFNTVGSRLGNDRFSEWARKFGLAKDEYGRKPSTGIEISESPGYVGTSEQGRISAANRFMKQIMTNLEKTKYGGYTIEPDSAVYDEIYNMLREGVYVKDSLTAIGITNEKAQNYIKDLVNKMKTAGMRSNESIYMAMGQGQVALTPLQMAQYIATLVNGGTRYKAHLVKEVLNPDGSVKKTIEPEILNELNFEKKNLETVLKGMGEVTTEAGGSGRKVFGQYPILTGGKTGTAEPEVSNPEEKGRDNYAWYVSYAPLENPEIVVVAVMYDAGHGGYSAYIARDVLDAYFKDHPVYKNDPKFQAWLANKSNQGK